MHKVIVEREIDVAADKAVARLGLRPIGDSRSPVPIAA